ncbi:MAG: FUSC family protein, partial [Candidatus Dormibacteraeota bacterium]|nr:FUSC family protein [Candidatus Dormibacteraeota bacterium]
MDLLRRVLARDAGLTALRRALRAAIVMPAAFAVSVLLLRDPVFASFAAFGSMATVLFVEFSGPMRDRLLAQLALILTQLLLITVGTLAGQEVWLAVPVTLVVAFLVIFAGVVSSVLATATTSLLLAYILPVTLSGGLDSLPLRLLGWAFAGALSLVAIAMLWPSPSREPLRDLTARACELLGRRLRAEVEYMAGGRTDSLRQLRQGAVAEARGAVGRLRTTFFSAPYRPAGLATSTRAVLRLVDEVLWLDTVLERTPAGGVRFHADTSVRAVKLAASEVLERCADLLEHPETGSDPLQPELSRLREAREQMGQAVTSDLPLRGVVTKGEMDREVTEFVTSLEPSFRALEMSFAVSSIAANVRIQAAARRRTWPEQMLGRQPEGSVSALRSARDRLGSHLRIDSVWLHNSLRGAIAVALAVLVADLVGAQHSFWVVLGTLSVLRSSALNTGQNALRAVIGNVIGFVIGGLLIVLIGVHSLVYWALLPLAVLVAGLAPAVISFAAGQAAFTVTLLVLYNILAPVGWQVGLVRIEDVVIGVAVSVAVGFLFWPRGAGSALGHALADALAGSAQYLRRAVEFGVTRCDRSGVVAPAPTDEEVLAAAAARRLDDAFREFLAERGGKS